MAKIEKKQRYGIWYSHKTENYLKLIVCHAGGTASPLTSFNISLSPVFGYL